MAAPDTPSFDDQRSVRQWRASFAQFWHGGAPEPGAFEALERFVEFCGAGPDEIIDDVLRPEEGGNRLMLRTRARRKYMSLIEEFERKEGSRQNANGVRSFMIHNGVAMNPGILR